LIAVVALLVLSLCCCCVFGITRGPVIRLMCRVSDTACASFCRTLPGECVRLRLPPPRR
jgi:hypothetical protein